MKVLPAIDIRGGRCVQLVGGDPGRERYSGDPVEAARRWVSEGADTLHVVNLDGALDGGGDLELLERVVEQAEVAQVGGGVRDLSFARRLVEIGADRVMVGTRALEPGFMEELSDELGRRRLVAALDCRGDEVVVEGWTEGSGVNFYEAVERLRPLVWGFLYTDVEREGRMVGASAEGVERFVEVADAPVIASGGVSSLKDVEALSGTRAWGVVIGSALYENAFTLREAMEAAS
ncbi:MAG: Imidazole glycerol phosphate synthase subunit HisF [Methanonatronarchaeales archaeon]|nr:Imidazole glycerol phosphate synthase subunit HisF [Methanonatronarchaeales archaeon]